jgi:hypothetical protein
MIAFQIRRPVGKTASRAISETVASARLINAAAADQTLFLAALPASLGLTVTGTHAGWAERGRTDALAGIGLAGAIGKTGIGGRIRKSQPIFERDCAGGCRSNPDETQRGAQQRLHQDSPVNVIGRKPTSIRE